MYVQSPSGMPSLAKRLRSNHAGPSEQVPRLPALLLKDAERVLRSTVPETPRRFLLHGYTTAAFRGTAETLAGLKQMGPADVIAAYSIKTSPAPELLGAALSCGMWAEAIAQTEVTHALALGFPPEHIVLNGPAKWWPTPGKVPIYGAIFCDSLQELQRLHRRVKTEKVRTEVFGLRLRPATVNSRFGIGLHDLETYRRVVEVLDSLPHRQDIGFHFHIASSMFGVRTWQSLAENFLAAVELLCRQLRTIRTREVTLSFGGGWHPDDWPDFLSGHCRELLAACRRKLPMVRRIILEPGKALAQRSMCLATRVLEVRRHRRQTELVVDGSIAELPDVRSHPHRVVSLNASGRPTLWTPGKDRILGRLCMEFDILSDAIEVPQGLREGTVIAYLDAGAYDASMAYSFGRGGGRLQ